MLSVRISNYGCTQEVWRAREKRKSCRRHSGEELWLLECSPKSPSASIAKARNNSLEHCMRQTRCDRKKEVIRTASGLPFQPFEKRRKNLHISCIHNTCVVHLPCLNCLLEFMIRELHCVKNSENCAILKQKLL